MLKRRDIGSLYLRVALLFVLAFTGLLAVRAIPAEGGYSATAVETGNDSKTSGDNQVVSIVLPRNTVTEGSEATIRLHRGPAFGSLEVKLRVAGTAVLGGDYRLEGMAGQDGDSATVVFADGQAVAVLAVDLVDDEHAEARESITLRLDDGDGYTLQPDTRQAVLLIAANDTLVTTPADSGEGSLRQAILNANALDGPHIIRFDSETGPFAEPQTILLQSELPVLTGNMTIDGRIDGRLWQATGITLSGGGERRVLQVAAGGDVHLHSLTVAGGRAERGGGIVNEGRLAVEGVTFDGNSADEDGGALANLGGSLSVVNSTFANNEAQGQGGGLANLGGEAVVANCTFAQNTAAAGGGLSSNGKLRLSNSILADNPGASDCLSLGDWDAASTRNIIVANRGCGIPVSQSDPKLQRLGGYNGPTATFPLGGGSPALNFGDNAAAVDHRGEPLLWDQRGNGDPRFVAGITDIGAFENQRDPWLVVDTTEDSGARGCTRALVGDCSLRGAIMLVNATGDSAHIRFDNEVFANGANLALRSPLPEMAADLLVDAGDAVVIEPLDSLPVFTCQNGIEVRTSGLRLPGGDPVPGCKGSHD